MKRIKSKWNSIPLAIKVSTAYVICNILQKCLTFITLPLFTRLLTTEQYGQYTVYSSWSQIICIFITLNLAYGSFSPAMIKFENDRDRYISSIQGICLMLSAAFLLLYLPLQKFWNVFFELPTFLIVIMVAEIITQTSIQLWSGKKRFEFKYKSVVAVTLITSILAPLCAFILVKNSAEKGYARIIGYTSVTIVTGAVFFAINLIRGKHLFTKEYWKYALGFNIPLLAYYLSQMIFNQSDRIMIDHFGGKGDAAMYGVAYNLAMILTFVLNSINNSYVPWMYEKIKTEHGEENKKVSVGIAVLMGLMILCVIWYAPEIIVLMAGQKYASAIPVVAPVAMSLLLLFYSQLFINVEFYYEEKKMLVWASIGAALLNIALNWLLIPKFGIVAAGYTTLASYVIFALSNFLAMKRTLKKHGKEDNLYSYKGLIIVMVSFMASAFLGVVLYKYIIPRVIITAVVFLLLVLFRKKIMDSLSFIKKSKS